MPIPKSQPKRGGEAIALATLREIRKWTQQDLAEASGRSRTGIALLETGGRTLKRELLYELTAFMGCDRAQVDAFLFAIAGSLPLPEEERRASGMSEVEAQALRTAAYRLGLSTARDFEEAALEASREKSFAEARQRVAVVGRQVFELAGAKQGAFLKSQPGPMIYALVEWLCNESERLAAIKPASALESARFAVTVAEFAPEGWQQDYLQGWALAFVGNAQRTMRDFPASSQTFARIDGTLQAAGAFRHRLLPLWRPLSMMALLYRVQRRFDRALQLHHDALADAGDAGKAIVLLNLATTLEQMGDHVSETATLEEVRRAIDSLNKPRLTLAHRFKLAVNLVHRNRVSEAEMLLPEIRRLAIGLNNEQDLMKVLWLSARVKAGLGHYEEAISSFAQARQYFAETQIAYDAAEIALEEAILRLRGRDYRGTKSIVSASAWIFRAQGLHQDALAAIRLFCQAVEAENATPQLVEGFLERFRKAPETRESVRF